MEHLAWTPVSLEFIDQRGRRDRLPWTRTVASRMPQGGPEEASQEAEGR